MPHFSRYRNKCKCKNAFACVNITAHGCLVRLTCARTLGETKTHIPEDTYTKHTDTHTLTHSSKPDTLVQAVCLFYIHRRTQAHTQNARAHTLTSIHTYMKYTHTHTHTHTNTHKHTHTHTRAHTLGGNGQGGLHSLGQTR